MLVDRVPPEGFDLIAQFALPTDAPGPPALLPALCATRTEEQR